MQDLERFFAVSSLFLQRTWIDCIKQSNPITKVEMIFVQGSFLICFQGQGGFLISFLGQGGDQAGWQEEEAEADVPLQVELVRHSSFA